MLGSRLRHLPAGLVGLALGALLSIVSAAVALAGGGPSYRRHALVASIRPLAPLPLWFSLSFVVN